MEQNQSKGEGVGLELGKDSSYVPRITTRNTVTMQHHGVEEQVSELFGKLNLSAKEKEVLVLEDGEDSSSDVVNHAVIGKVLAPNSLPLQTIMAAMRPAWGNPKGLLARMVGDNLFIAEFESEMDKKRILDGSPWYIGRQAVGRQVVILKEFNYDLRPSEVSFDDLAIWVNILNLPLALRDERWGLKLAGKIGKKVLKIDVDSQKRALGKDLRARVLISLKDPLPRGVSVFSSRRQRKEWYDVVYERLPFFCFSCGIIGHSEIECPTTATRDEKGCLPYSEKLRAPEERRFKNQGEWYPLGGSSSKKNNSSGTWGSSDSRKSSTKITDDDGSGQGKEIGVLDDDDNNTEAYSRARNIISNDDIRLSKDLILYDGPGDDMKLSTYTKKQKSDDNLLNNIAGQEGDSMAVLAGCSTALVPSFEGNFSLEGRSESGTLEYLKKTKNENAGLLKQPRVKK